MRFVPWIRDLFALAVVVGALSEAGCACGGSDAPTPQRLIAREPLVGATATAELGEDCSAAGCKSGLCLNFAREGGSSAFACTTVCRTTADCPVDFVCAGFHPAGPDVCVPPRSWRLGRAALRASSAGPAPQVAPMAIPPPVPDGGR